MPEHVVMKTIYKIGGISAVLMAIALIGFASNGAYAQQAASKASLPPMSEILAERVLGNADAPVTVIEYASMTCGHCAAFHADTYPKIKKEYIDTGRVKFLLRNFPLNSLDWAASMMTRCAPKERFFPIVDILLKTQQNWMRVTSPAEALAKIGLLAGISQKSFEACISNKEIFDGMSKITSKGDKKFKITGTPTFVINGKKMSVEGSIENFRKIIDAELAKAKK